MTALRSKGTALLSTAMVVLLLAGTSEAPAQNLFDRLFGNNQVNRFHREPPPQASEPQRQPVEVPRVRGPQYYEYKTDALVTVDFAAIRPVAGMPADNAPGLDKTTVGTSGTAGSEPGPEGEAQARGSGRVVSGGSLEDAVEAALRSNDEPAVEIEAGTGRRSNPEFTADAATSAGQAAHVAAQPLTDEAVAALAGYELQAEKAIAEAVVAHYSAEPQFIWVSDDEPNRQARDVLTVLADAESHGLDPQDYAVGVPQSLEGLSETGRLSALARFETTLSARVLRYMRDARLGRIDPNRISGYHDFEAEPFDAGAMLEELASTDDLEALLERQHPQNDFYRALRAELEMQRARQENDIVVAADTFVRPGQSNAEFPKILKLIEQREELVLSPEEEEILSRNAASETYLQELVPVVKAAQRSAGLQDDGIVGPRTVRELAGLSRSARIGMLEASLERIRWLPSDLGDRYVFLNAPSFTAAYFEDGEEKLSMRAIYGSKATQTYFFQDRIAYVEFHPYWGVPRSILVNKYLRKLISDPSYLDRNGFEVTDRSGRTIPSSAIDWGAYGANIPFDVRQLPGSGNALGELKVMFPNKHAIYMHDTPEKHLFERDNRALSNGCVRLQDPRAMAAAVLGWTREQVAARLQGPHSRENLEVEVPVYVGYFTAWPTAGGEVAYHGDVYDRDARISAAIEKVRALRNTGA